MRLKYPLEPILEDPTEADSRLASKISYRGKPDAQSEYNIKSGKGAPSQDRNLEINDFESYNETVDNRSMVESNAFFREAPEDKPREDPRAQSEIVRRGAGRARGEDPFAEGGDFEFPRTKSDQKVSAEKTEAQPSEGDLFEESGAGEGAKEELDFEDNFGDFQAKKKGFDFGFGEEPFEDPFGAPQEKPEAPKEDFNFDFGDAGKAGEDPFAEAEPREEPVRVEPRPSENLEFGDPFEAEKGKEDAFDIFEKNTDRSPSEAEASGEASQNPGAKKRCVNPEAFR